MVKEIVRHPLARELQLSPEEVLDVIAGARRLKMTVRGWVAERHLRDRRAEIPGMTECEWLEAEGSPDLRVRCKDGPFLTVECKNVLREADKDKLPRLDFQRTRHSKADPCRTGLALADANVMALG
jgi:hypothetical protein